MANFNKAGVQKTGADTGLGISFKE